MRIPVLFGSVIGLFVGSLLFACVGEDPGSGPASVTLEAGVAIGERGGPCYANKTCNEGLVCEDEILCITKPISGSPRATDGGGAGPVDASTDAADAGDGDAGSCKRTGAVFSPWSIKPPVPKTAACTDAQIAQLADACFTAPDGPSCMILRGQYAACATCAFGHGGNSQWAPIVTGYPSGKPVYYNIAGCYEYLSNNSGCGIEYQRVIDCFDLYCAACTGADETSCQKQVGHVTGECKAYLLNQTCGNLIDIYEGTCGAKGTSDAELKAHFINLVSVACK